MIIALYMNLNTVITTRLLVKLDSRLEVKVYGKTPLVPELYVVVVCAPTGRRCPALSTVGPLGSQSLGTSNNYLIVQELKVNT